MKKIINNKVYNTKTAKELAVWNNDYAVNDFNHVCETLHKKKTGEFFLHGQGGPMSRYATPAYGSSNSWTGGEEIIPLTYEQAREWAEESLDGDEYVSIFGEPEDGEVYINVKISSKAKAKLDEIRSKKCMTMSEVVESLIMNHENN